MRKVNTQEFPVKNLVESLRNAPKEEQQEFYAIGSTVGMTWSTDL